MSLTDYPLQEDCRTQRNGENGEDKESVSCLTSQGSRNTSQVSSLKVQVSRFKSQESVTKNQCERNPITRIPPSTLTEMGEMCARTAKKVRERDSRYELAREIKGFQERIRRELSYEEHKTVIKAWFSKSTNMEQNFDKHLAASLYEVTTVKKPKGGNGDFQRLVKTVSDTPVDKLPVIPREPDACEDWRRLAALHRELARRSKDGVYVLSLRDAASAIAGLDKDQVAHANTALVRLGVIEKVDSGAAGKRKGVAARWRYLLPPDDNAADEEPLF